MEKKNKFCNNCGNFGHYVRQCNEPKTSYGIIAISYDNNIKDKIDKIKKNLEYNYIDVNNYNYLHLNNINQISNFYNSIKFLMICRKHSLNYVEFIRGKYNTYDSAVNMLKLMSKNEVNNIITHDFNYLWTNLWLDNSKSHLKEYKKSKNKFKSFITPDNIKEIKKLDLIYEEPEWGFLRVEKICTKKILIVQLENLKKKHNILLKKKYL